MQKLSFPVRKTLVVALFALSPGLAMAYIDPGSGAYMVQAIFTVIGAALFYLKHPIRSIRTIWLTVSDLLSKARHRETDAASRAQDPLVVDSLASTSASDQT